VSVPDEIHDTIPVVEPTVATVRLALLHTPVGIEFDNVVVVPVHAVSVPVIAGTVEMTVTVSVV
jgi:hypothetical protein